MEMTVGIAVTLMISNTHVSLVALATITNLTTLHQRENGMVLCVVCRRTLVDIEIPAWVFLPSNLDYFIEFELNNYRHRTEEYHATSVFPRRKCPKVEEYLEECGGLYDAYMLRCYGAALSSSIWRPGRSTFLDTSKIWHGDPMSALHKGFKALGEHNRLLPRELWTLSELYQENDMRPRSIAHDDDNDDLNDHHHEDQNGEDEVPGIRDPRRRDATNKSRGPGGDIYAVGSTTLPGHLEQLEGSPEPKRGKVEVSPWQWGPHKTSDDRAKYYRHIKHGIQARYREMMNLQEDTKETGSLAPDASKTPKEMRKDIGRSSAVLGWLAKMP
ncbi:MAG: hypothetical protein Q9219_005604 [cf. Caloplaca sp. 3 TL-2023]